MRWLQWPRKREPDVEAVLAEFDRFLPIVRRMKLAVERLGKEPEPELLEGLAALEQQREALGAVLGRLRDTGQYEAFCRSADGREGAREAAAGLAELKQTIRRQREVLTGDLGIELPGEEK